jgi:hypothetical protein
MQPGWLAAGVWTAAVFFRRRRFERAVHGQHARGSTSHGAGVCNRYALVLLPLSLHSVADCAGGNFDVVQVMQVVCDPVGRVPLVEDAFKHVSSYIICVFGVRWHVGVDDHE